MILNEKKSTRKELIFLRNINAHIRLQMFLLFNLGEGIEHIHRRNLTRKKSIKYEIHLFYGYHLVSQHIYL